MDKNVQVNPYEAYITKLYRTIPENSVLITRNKFNGKDIDIYEGGFALIMPWKESKLISLAVRNFDYPETIFEDSNGQDVIMDLAVTVKVSDPIKYEYYNKDTEKELKQLITSSMRTIVNKSKYADLKSKRFNVNNYGIYNNIYFKNLRYDQRGTFVGEQINFSNPLTEQQEFDKQLCEFRVLLDEFSTKYGLKVVDLYNKKVQQTDEMQQAYNKKIKAEKEAQALEISKKAELERAKIDLEISKINAQASATAEKLKYEAILSVIENLSLTPAEKANYIQSFMFASGKDNVAGAAAAAVAGATAGISSTINNENSGKAK